MMYENAVQAGQVAVKLYNDLLKRVTNREAGFDSALEALVKADSLMDNWTDTPKNPERVKNRLLSNKDVAKLLHAILGYSQNHNLIDFFSTAGKLVSRVYQSLLSSSFTTSVFPEPEDEEYKRLKRQVGEGSAKATWYHNKFTEALRPQPQPAPVRT